MVRTLYDIKSGELHQFDDSFIAAMIAGASYSKTEVDRIVTAVLRFKGTKTSYDKLPTKDNKVGDVWAVSDSGSEYVWTDKNAWNELGPLVDLSGYMTASEIKALLGAIPEGKTVKDLIDGVAASGSGNETAISEIKNSIGTLATGKTVAGLLAELSSAISTQGTSFTNMVTEAVNKLSKQIGFVEDRLEKIGYELTTDVTAVAGKNYFTRDAVTGTYSEVTVEAGASVAGYFVKNSKTVISVIKEFNTVFDAAKTTITAINLGVTKTKDTAYATNKKYYQVVDDEPVLLIEGEDYTVGSEVTGDVYETATYTMKDVAGKLNEMIGSMNLLIVAHQAKTEE